MIESAHVTPAYLQFLEHPALRQFIRDFMRWKKDVLVTRTILRHQIPSAASTGIHYDQIYLRGGDPADEFLTAWIPIGDIAIDGGGLMYFEGSTKLGRQTEADFTRNAQHMTKEERISAFNANMTANGALSTDAETYAKKHLPGGRWLASTYEAGDVVFHNPYMVHGAAVNEDTKGRIRLSTDLRFYEEGMKMDERWMKVFEHTDGL
jgi:phytanoyl-CoA hydroxylase